MPRLTARRPLPFALGTSHERTTMETAAQMADSCLARRVTITPSMCGHNSLFMGHVGDWTWDAVGRQCGLDVLKARTAEGAPTYLAFYYIHLYGNAQLHPLRLTFGDELDVASQVFDCGSESVLTLHMIGLANGTPPKEPACVGPAEFPQRQHADHLYIESFNRWISRTDHGNTALRSASPLGFRHRHLPRLPEHYSPRAAPAAARRAGSLAESFPEFSRQVSAPFTHTQHIDLTRDLNGVGLVHFASYFSFVDAAVLAYWRHQGRTDSSFLNRSVIDQKLCYFSNANIDTTLTTTVTAFNSPANPSIEILDISIRNSANNHLLAISSIHLQEPQHERPDQHHA